MCNNLHEPEGIMLTEKIPVSKGHLFHDVIFITILKLQSYEDVEQINGCQALGMVGDGHEG